MKKKIKFCVTCGERFEAPAPNSKTCSYTCRQERYAYVKKMNAKGVKFRGDGTEADFVGMDCKICGRHLVRDHGVTEFCVEKLARSA